MSGSCTTRLTGPRPTTSRSSTPTKLKELQQLFELEAGKYNVFPLDDRKAERANPDLAGRPEVVRGSTQMFFPGMRRVQENTVINTKNKSHSVTADIEVPPSGARGVIVAQGGAQGGWAMYAHEGRLRYHYNLLGAKRAAVISDAPIPAGAHQVRMEFGYDGGGLGKGGERHALLRWKADRPGPGRAHAPVCVRAGRDAGGRVRCRGTGLRGLRPARQRLQWQGQLGQIDVDAAAKDIDHMIGAEERFRFAMARQ
jgi:hypothetical protein